MLNPYVFIVAVAIVFGAYVVGHSRGYSEADQRAKVAELQFALAAAQQDLNAAHTAAELSREAAEENHQAAAAAEQRVSEYEAELAKRGDAGRCLADGRDIEWLSKRGATADRSKPARR